MREGGIGAWEGRTGHPLSEEGGRGDEGLGSHGGFAPLASGFEGAGGSSSAFGGGEVGIALGGRGVDSVRAHKRLLGWWGAFEGPRWRWVE